MRTKLAVVVLGVLSVLGPVADLLGWAPLKGIAAATNAAPAMKVFTTHDGYETFSPQFHLEWQENGRPQSLTLTPSVYAGIRGPYNRRNAYGAALSYAPVLAANPATNEMHAAVTRYALCGRAPILSELGVDAEVLDGPVTVRIEPRGPVDPKWRLDYQVNCDG